MSIFGHFWPLIPPNPGLRIFMRKQKRHFSCFIVIQLCAKNQKDPMRGFLEKSVTDGRTNERTDGGELIGPISASGRGPKIFHISQTCIFDPGPPLSP